MVVDFHGRLPSFVTIANPKAPGERISPGRGFRLLGTAVEILRDPLLDALPDVLTLSSYQQESLNCCRHRLRFKRERCSFGEWREL